METQYDVLVIGGGLVGAALVRSLRYSSLRLALVESRALVANTDPDYNERSVALGAGSQRILQSLGVWDEIRPAAQPIRVVHVSERGKFGATRLRSEDLGLAALGYVALNCHIGAAFARCLPKQANLDMLAPANMVCTQEHADHIAVTLEVEGELKTVSTRLLVAADGTQSLVRQTAGLPTRVDDYGQAALIANVTPAQPHHGWAYERFTPKGPVAMLPLPDNRCALVWTQSPEEARDTLRLDDASFKSALEDWFGLRLGRIDVVGRRESYPLALTIAEQLTFHRGVVIGNAAHTLHPIAGQGLNLALRDVADLADVLVNAADPGAAEVLKRYESARAADISRTVAYTDGLLRLFTNPSPTLGHLRGAGLALLDRLPPLRHVMARQAMGLLHAGSSLTRGLNPGERSI